MLGPDGTKMSAVERDDGFGIQPFGECDHGRIGSTQRKIPVVFHQGGNPGPVLWKRRFDCKLSQPG